MNTRQNGTRIGRGRKNKAETHASRLVAKVLERTVKSKKSKVITVKRTVVVCAIVAATPTALLAMIQMWLCQDSVSSKKTLRYFKECTVVI